MQSVEGNAGSIKKNKTNAGVGPRVRQKIATTYNKALQNEAIQWPFLFSRHANYRYVVRTADAEEKMKLFERQGISVRCPVFQPLNWHVRNPGAFPEMDRAWKETVSFPLYPSFRKKEVRLVCQSISRLFS